ncbi:MAG: FG-GAP repeat protein [Gammaproteobacteria bacterium]|nr:FG-GAP repeat protein [Gammaproteobacteria bacterium]
MTLAACGGGGGNGESSGGTPAAPAVNLAYGLKTLQFSWPTVAGAAYYQLYENPDGISGFRQVGNNITTTSVDHAVALHKRLNARYLVAACNSAGCTYSAAVFLTNHLADAIGYFKASNTQADDVFGHSLDISADGDTLVIGAYLEDSSATGIGGDQADDSASAAGAVYIFTRSHNTWSQQAYLKASNAEAGDNFGFSLALSVEGNTLVVGAPFEDSDATGLGGDEGNPDALNSGAAYVFTRNNTTWSQQAYVKASNTRTGDNFGYSLALSGDGNTLAISAPFEDSGATGVGGNQGDVSATDAGAVYVFILDGGAWSQQAYVKASNTQAEDLFGHALALSGDGDTLAVGAPFEDSNATGVNAVAGDANNSSLNAGAVYVFARDGGNNWSQQAYVKASNTDAEDLFGHSLALAANGSRLAVGAPFEDSPASGIDNAQGNNAATQNAGAVYVFARDGGNNWSQQTYMKASNTEASDQFGRSLTLSGEGATLAVGAWGVGGGGPGEDSSAIGIGGNQADNAAPAAGAVYVFTLGAGGWFQQAYVKAANTEAGDRFGRALALSTDGDTLAVGAYLEASNAAGIGGNQGDNSASNAGAVYLY